MFGVSDSHGQLQAQESLPVWDSGTEISDFLGTTHTHFPLRTCHLSRALLGPLSLWVPKNSFPFPDKSPGGVSLFLPFRPQGTIFPLFPQHKLLQEFTFSENKQKPPLRQGLSSGGGVGEYSENKTSTDVLITYPGTFFVFSNCLGPCGGFKDL